MSSDFSTLTEWIMEMMVQAGDAQAAICSMIDETDFSTCPFDRRTRQEHGVHRASCLVEQCRDWCLSRQEVPCFLDVEV